MPGPTRVERNEDHRARMRRNPPGIYSKTTAQWLASMPTGKTSRYWDLKNIHFSHLVRQQGRGQLPGTSWR